MTRISRTLRSPDVIALVLLTLLWWLFFWRLFTPVADDRTMLIQGDFSGQFVAFGAYQYERISNGEIPLWNPHNNAGLPFIADTQAAVFYPPRLITIGLSNLTGGWNYNTLQLEMTFHVLLFTALMYLLVRRLTNKQAGSVLGSFASAIIAGYGGFITGYAPLQLALLEAAIWLPLALVGIVEATRSNTLHWKWLVVTGLGLGLSWMAGHPQTSWFSTCIVIAYFAYRVYQQKYSWQKFAMGIILFGAITFGVVAVQFVPAMEYSGLSMRDGLNFDDKGNGFPLQDIIQFLFPSVVSIYSPLYISVAGFILAIIAVLGKTRDYIFWIGLASIGLVLSFGANTALYHMIYNFMPGASLFRGQERFAFIVVIALTILAGHGLSILISKAIDKIILRDFRRLIASILGLCIVITVFVLVSWFGEPDQYNHVIQPIVFSTVIVGMTFVLITQLHAIKNSHIWGALLVMLLTFEVFTVTIDNVNFEPAQPNVLDPPALVEEIVTDQADEITPFRTDGNFFGLYGNYASIYGVYDIRGISPLFIDGSHAIIQRELPSEVAWELFAVRYVLSGVDELQEIEAENIGTELYRGERVDLHEISDPRPFAQLMTQYEVIDSDAFARAVLADPNFDERTTLILESPPTLEIPTIATTELGGTVMMTEYAPERFILEANTPENALLSLAHVDYPGWRARINGESIDLIRAYGALTALEIPAGEHTIEVYFAPFSYQLGAIISLITWCGMGLFGVFTVFNIFRKKNNAIA